MLRHWVNSSPAKRIASQDAQSGENNAREWSMFMNGLFGIAGAGGIKSTTGGIKRRDTCTITRQHKKEDFFYHYLTPQTSNPATFYLAPVPNFKVPDKKKADLKFGNDISFCLTKHSGNYA